MLPLTTLSTYDFQLASPTKNGAAWDLTGATVTLELRPPRGSVLVCAASVSGPSLAHYVSLTTDLAVGGTWERTWHVVQNGIDIRFPPISFLVKKAP